MPWVDRNHFLPWNTGCHFDSPARGHPSFHPIFQLRGDSANPPVAVTPNALSRQFLVVRNGNGLKGGSLPRTPKELRAKPYPANAQKTTSKGLYLNKRRLWTLIVKKKYGTICILFQTLFHGPDSQDSKRLRTTYTPIIRKLVLSVTGHTDREAEGGKQYLWVLLKSRTRQ